jgi:hypothetical protein
MDPIVLEAGDRVAVRPTSCHCGASEALYLLKNDGLEISLGCACHHVVTLNIVRGPTEPTFWYLIDNDPEHYEEWSPGPETLEWGKAHFDVRQYTRFVLINEEGYVPDHHSHGLLPDRFGKKVAETMESHFEFKGTENQLVFQLRLAGIPLADNKLDHQHLKKPGEPWFYEKDPNYVP